VFDQASGMTFPSIWDALFDDPVEATNLRMRADLMTAIERHVREWGVTQKEAAVRLGITQPRLNLLLKGRIDDFSLDALVALLKPAGLEIEFSVKPA
jgi:predicted XRE-type DNA-binding protein